MQSQAWSMRGRLVDVWPSTAVKSLGAFAQGMQGTKRVTAIIAKHPHNLSLLKHATQIAAAQATAGVVCRQGVTHLA